METDDFELDDSPIVSACDIDDPEDGAWVRAWVHIDAGDINTEMAKGAED